MAERTVIEASSSASSLEDRGPAARGIALACWALVVAFVLLTAWQLREFDAVREFAVFAVFWLVGPLGIGIGALTLLDVAPSRVGRVLLPAAAGWSLSAVVTLAAANAGAAAFAFPLLVVLGITGWVVRIRSQGWDLRGMVRSSVFSVGTAAESALVAATMFAFVGIGASQWLMLTGTRVVARQYWDLQFHLAFVKRGIYAGLPIRDYPLIAQFPKLTYHSAIDTLTTVVIKGLHLPIDSAFYAILLPATYAAFIIAIFAALRAWSGRLRPVLISVAVILVCLAAAALPAHLRLAIGTFGLEPFRWFLFNPPGALGATATFVALALLCDPEKLSVGTVALAGVLIGASIAMKAQIAVVAGPAFVAALVTAAVTKRLSWKLAIVGTGVTGVSAVLAYLTTTGIGGIPSIQFGAMAEFLTTSRQVVLSSAIVRTLGAHAAGSMLGAVAFLMFYVLIALTGWRLVLGLAAAPFARRRGYGMSGRFVPLVFMGWTIVGLVVSALLLVQREPYVFLAWNMSWNSMQIVAPISVLLSSILVDAALPVHISIPKSLSRWPIVLPLIVVMLGLGTGLAAARSMRPVRLVGTAGAPRDFVRLVERLPELTPVNAVVAQDVQLERNNWVSSLGGRRAYAERLASPELAKGYGPQLRATIHELYSTADTLRARALMTREGIDYVIVARARVGAGLAGATQLVTRVGSFELRKR